MTKKIVKRYSTAFKQQIAKEYEEGASISALQKKYGITGSETIKRWVDKYSRKGIRHKLMYIQSPEERNQLQKCKEKISQLEKAVAQLTLEKLMLEATLATAEKEMGIEVKKNGVRKLSKKLTSVTKRKETV